MYFPFFFLRQVVRLTIEDSQLDNMDLEGQIRNPIILLPVTSSLTVHTGNHFFLEKYVPCFHLVVKEMLPPPKKKA